MRSHRVECPGWSLDPVFSASSFRERLLGMAALPSDSAMLIRGRSVHGLWIRRPMSVVALDADMVVLGSRVLPPRRAVLFGRAAFLVELPGGRPLPPVGARLELADSRVGSPRP